MTATALEPVAAAGEHFVLHDVSWELYEMLLKEAGDQRISITYDQGSLELVSPSETHESYKKLIGGLIEVLAIELNVPMLMFGSTTFKRRDLNKGAEPDECYYVQNLGKVKGKRKLDLTTDPPPDLVVEVDITSRSVARNEIYRAMGVGEIWRFDGLKLHVTTSRERGGYSPADQSRALPLLKVSELERFINMLPASDHVTILRAFRDWVRATLA